MSEVNIERIIQEIKEKIRDSGCTPGFSTIDVPFPDDIDEINVEWILQEIRDDIRDLEINSDIIMFEDVPFPKRQMQDEQIEKKELDQMIKHLLAESTIQYYYDIPKGFKGIIKRFIRKTVHFVFYPIMESQNRFNADVANLVQRYIQIEHKQLLKRINRLESENNRLNRKINKMNC